MEQHFPACQGWPTAGQQSFPMLSPVCLWVRAALGEAEDKNS